MLRTSISKRNEEMAGWPIDGVPVKRQVGMIFWYSWGQHEFDIRVMRSILGLPERIAADHWFMSKRPNPCTSYEHIMAQLVKALAGRTFSDVLAEHDRLLEEEHQILQEKVAAGELVDDIPF